MLRVPAGGCWDAAVHRANSWAIRGAAVAGTGVPVFPGSCPIVQVVDHDRRGIGIALPAAWALRRLVEAQLFGVGAFDGPTVAAASCLLALVALGAALRPAWRAASVSPTEALRSD